MGIVDGSRSKAKPLSPAIAATSGTSSRFDAGAAASCPMCGAADVAPAGQWDGYPMGRCRRCQHFYCLALPDAATLEHLYAAYSYESQGLDSIPEFVFRSLARLMDSFEPYRRTHRLLDVGFGIGTVLRAATEAGWQAHGVEKSSLAVAKARAAGFRFAEEADFLTVPYPAGHFDVITLADVVEHLPDPGPFLRRAFELLRPGGLLYISTPNGLGLNARLLGVEWTVVSPPEHLHLFSRDSIGRALAAAGFGEVTIRTEGLNPFELVAAGRRGLGRLRARLPSRPTVAATASDVGSASAAQVSPAATPGFSRVESAYALNRTLMASGLGQLVKRAANATLSALRLGDELKVWAIKPLPGAAGRSGA